MAASFGDSLSELANQEDLLLRRFWIKLFNTIEQIFIKFLVFSRCLEINMKKI